RPNVAGIYHGPPGAGAALERQAASRANVQRDIDSVEVLVPLSVFVREARQVVDLPGQRGNDVEQPWNDVATAARQPRVQRGGDGIRRVIRRLGLSIINRRETGEPTAVVRDFDRRADR